ncbi:unnamed protein product [Larinioides sclopetarius]|uniref:Uncharacterized protein n=1 Tax=Larinioides sclopetarius TaxID=280406 RepID=A0AAV1Z2A6_9ARAC
MPTIRNTSEWTQKEEYTANASGGEAHNEFIGPSKRVSPSMNIQQSA